MGVSGQRQAPAVFYPWERTPGTHWIELWVGPRAGLDTRAGGKSFGPAKDRPTVVEPVVRKYNDWAILSNGRLSVNNGLLINKILPGFQPRQVVKSR
jgi:hypothetical protein